MTATKKENFHINFLMKPMSSSSPSLSIVPKSKFIDDDDLTDLEDKLITSEREIINAEIELLNFLGRGGNGEVFRARPTQMGVQTFGKKCIAVKRLKLTHVSVAEALNLGIFNSKHIVKYLGSWVEKCDHMFYIAMELAVSDVNCVLKAAKKGERAPPMCSEITSWLHQCCLALNLCHQSGICHRDVKPHNMLLFPSKHDDSFTLKLTDFGISGVIMGMNKSLDDYVGTPHYLAPEVILREKYNTSADMWSLGVCLFEWLTLRRPFNNCREVTEADDLSSSSLVQCLPAEQQQQDHYYLELVSICCGLLQKSPHSRLSAQDVIYRLQSFSEGSPATQKEDL